MLNPSYLIQSRHSVYYFRYPLGNKRVSVSLKTRCPKEALRLAKTLDYHSAELIKNIDWGSMDHADIMAMFKTYYAEVLERVKAKIDKEGPLPKENVANLQESLREWGEIIEGDADDLPELLGAEYENPEEDPMKKDLQPLHAVRLYHHVGRCCCHFDFQY